MMGLSWQQGTLGRNPNGTFVSATVPRADVVDDALHPVEGQTFCPYKGLASSYDVGDA
jgi:uncharacterized protein (DUF427 family)